MSHKKTTRIIRPHHYQRLACKSSPGIIPGFIAGEIASRERSLGFYLPNGMPLPNPDPVLKRMGKDITVYQDLLSDAHIGGCADSRAAGVLSLNWAVDQGKDPTPATDFCSDMLKALDMNKLITEILSAPLFGYTPLEITWQLGADNKVRVVKVEMKPRRWFVYDGTGSLMFRSKENPMGEQLPPRKFLQARHKAGYENPYGEAVMGRVFWPGAFKKGGFKFWAVFTEKFGMPRITGKVPRGTGPDEINELLSQLENMVQDAIAVIPDDCSIEINTPAASIGSVDVFDRFLDRCDNYCSIALLGQTLTTSVGDKGSYAAAKTHMQVRGDIVAGDKKIVEQTIQQILNWTCELNFPGEPAPIYSMFEPEDVDMEQASRDVELGKVGVRFKKTYFQREYGLKENDFDLVDPEKTSAPAVPFAGKAPAPAVATATVPDPVIAAVDKLDPAQMQAQMEDTLSPVMEAIKIGSYADIEAGLIAAYPEMDTKNFQEMLARAIYVSELWGRLSANKA